MAQPRLFHISTESLWAEAQESGLLQHPSLAQEGFLHASTEEQLLATANRWFQGQRGLLVIELDEAALGESLRFEAPHPPRPETEGQLFPHIYGAVPREAILQVAPLAPDETGRFVELPL